MYFFYRLFFLFFTIYYMFFFSVIFLLFIFSFLRPLFEGLHKTINIYSKRVDHLIKMSKFMDFLILLYMMRFY